ncbi:tripartite tricarboxylate transporter substrate binding protein [Hoeflea sp. 108]|jgi:tripartite-type tricarboxylate transporter receptor subunit TctC|uniref:tripartite tricarboxylate transporter substrate binding protein n=1 Tax=Hoeflea sp. 108 TaxID=1116369 RepID=UPI0003647D68|nr:tripartite tricarboxylate transporter substrate binding protein [Hoeflea sp. 108]
MNILKTLGSGLVILAGFLAASAASAQSSFPSKPIQLVVPAKPGGDTDLNSRLLAKHIGKHLSQPLVVVNTDGGGGNMAAQKVAASPADGHTILMLNTVLFTGRAVGTLQLGLDDFEVIGIPSYSDTLLWVTRKDAPFKTLPELSKAVLAAPDTVKYAATVGAPSHLQAIAYEEAIAGDLKKIDTGSGSDKIVAVLSGQVDVLTTNYSLVKDYITTGEMVVLGNLGRERSPFIPDVPTFAEGGVKLGPDFNMFYVLLAPKGTPQEVIAVLSDAVKKTVEDPEVKKEFEKSYFTVNYRDSAAAKTYLREREPEFMAMKDLIAADKF